MLRTDLAVILAGGLGTRLRSILPQTPKILAPIKDKPLLGWQIEYLKQQGIKKCLLLLCYQAKQVQEYCGDGRKWGIHLEVSIEKEPLDKGGALKNALPLIDRERFFLLNGDTFLDFEWKDLEKLHQTQRADLSIALKFRKDLSGVDPVSIDEKGRVVAFGTSPAQALFDESEGFGYWVNGGVYLVERDLVVSFPEGRLSWEKEAIPSFLNAGKRVFGFPIRGYFIDIGTPEAYLRAQTEIPLLFSSRPH